MSIAVIASGRPGLPRPCTLALVCAFVLAMPGRADPLERLGDLFTEKLDVIQVALQRGQWDLYASGYAWHLPWGYSDATRARLNETTWGGGFGRSLWTEDGDRHSVFVMSFSDSHRTPQYIASYGWHRYWSPHRKWSLGWGYLAFLFSREDVAGWAPLPGILPSASIRYRRWEAMGVFVPRVSRDIKGDVFFVFGRIAL